MHELLARLRARHPNLVARHFELRVLPDHNALVLSGYALLREYREVAGEARFEGGESRQVKEALRALMPAGAGYVVEVRLAPALERQREATYPFFVTERFESPEALEAELARMRKTGLIGEHTYPISTPTHEGEEA